jgi:hypothetical protein
LEQELDEDVVCRSILFNLYSHHISNEALEGFGDFKIKGQEILSVKCADDLLLLAKEKGCYRK